MKYIIGLCLSILFSALSALTPIGVVVLRLSEKLPVLLVVLLAAVFVRLARGLPTIPYEKVAASKAYNATRAFRKLTQAYVQTFVIFIIAIILNLVYSSLLESDLTIIPIYIAPSLLGFIDGMVILSIAFLVRSDVALARTQADLMDDVTSALSKTAAATSVSNVKESFKVPDRDNPKISAP